MLNKYLKNMVFPGEIY